MFSQVLTDPCTKVVENQQYEQIDTLVQDGCHVADRYLVGCLFAYLYGQ